MLNSENMCFVGEELTDEESLCCIRVNGLDGAAFHL